MSYDEGVFQMYLGEVPMFQACSEEELGAVAYLASPQALDAGAEIVREGDSGDDFYALMMGLQVPHNHSLRVDGERRPGVGDQRSGEHRAPVHGRQRERQRHPRQALPQTGGLE
jgi:hypothetical protein